MKVRKMRILRHKYHISRKDLATLCGVSPQRISRIELEDYFGLESSMAKRIREAFETIIASRQSELSTLRTDFEKNKESLFDRVEEIGYEL